jgi:shikimate dehydrogenase
MKIVLIGFMGSGKSTVAAIVAKKLGEHLIEIDQLTEKIAGKKIKELVKSGGEELFRTYEAQAVKELENIANAVISTGGGTVLNEESFKILSSPPSVVIYLKAKFATISKRLLDLSERPLFKDPAQAQKLYDSRASKYELIADRIVNTDHLSAEEVASEIIKLLPKVCTIIGDPVEHSLSPALHSAGYKALNIQDRFIFTATPLKKEDLKSFFTKVRQAGIRGISCTMPHKQAVMPFLDYTDQAAKNIGAVNTIVNENDSLKGYNTDWLGIVTPLEKLTSLAGASVFIIGTGGAARAAAWGVSSRGADVTIWGRNKEAAKTMASALPKTQAADSIAAAKNSRIIIHATPLGMPPHEDECLLDENLISSKQIVFDIVYHKKETEILRRASARGAAVIPGVEMFLYQAMHQFKLFTGYDAPEEAFKKFLETQGL